MLEMSCLIQYRLELVLKVTLKPTTDIVSKSPVLSKIFLIEILEFRPND